jgi:hypothetical protein
MKQYIFVCLGCILGITMAVNGTNKTVPVNNDLLVDGDDEGFYTVDVLLVADRAPTAKIG